MRVAVSRQSKNNAPGTFVRDVKAQCGVTTLRTRSADSGPAVPDTL
jgi:hypothetical protein